MAWEPTEWACGHRGAIQLLGKQSGRNSRVAFEAGRKCFACWLIGEWERSSDPRAKNPKRWDLATAIAEHKGTRIYGAEKVEA